MTRDCRIHFLTAIGAIGLGFMAGCQTKAKEPAQPAPVATPDASPSSSVAEEKVAEESPFELESDFTTLALSHFDSFGKEADTWTEAPEGFHCTGKPRGYLYSRQPYKNFTLRLDYRFERPANLKDETKFKGNTGFLVYITGEQKLWPLCIEIQGKNAQIAAIKENGGADPVTSEDDDAARQQARKSVGQWNRLEIVSKDGELKAALNGVPISHSQAGPLTEGLIGVQSEDYAFDVRRMRIRAE